MSHPQQRRFLATVAEFLPEFFVGRRVLEIGSLDVNGSARAFFADCDYTGLDLAPGPGVDVVRGGHEFDAPDGTFDVVVSMETMEHNPYWIDTVRNMLRLCRPGGLVVLSCASIGRPEHGTTRTDPGSSPPTVGLGWEHYRNVTEAELRATVASSGHPVVAGYWTNWQSHDLYMAALKGAPEAAVGRRFASLSDAIETDVTKANRAPRVRIKRVLLRHRLGETAITSVRRLRTRWRGA
jgi:SAM-dependent methyltransferase